MYGGIVLVWYCVQNNLGGFWDGNEFSVGCWLVLLVFVHWNEVVSSGAEHGIRLLVLMVQE